ncbi:DUF4365 domain-containing protein [Bacillus infantis]|uniref:DUF4365 domain-containing protein n=1 Tax=Bacillus infantis TaxID=324767 RepID=UPI003CF1E158
MIRKKKVQDKKVLVDSTIIEHLAVLEVNRLILQPPFRLISNISLNDKGVSYDGDIEVYNQSKIEKVNLVNKVPVQVKGTTIEKTIIQKEKISHPVQKKDIEVYYNGGGVLYFVVTVNPVTYVRQAYYHILAPLELKGLLSQLAAKKQDSISLHFKKLENGNLEGICRTFINLVGKQPKHYIEASRDKEFTQYKVNFVDVKGDSFNLFEETAYIYGVSSDHIEMPIEAVKISKLRKRKTEILNINDDKIEVYYEVTNSQKDITIVIENTLTIKIDTHKKKGDLKLGRVKTLGSYIKCLQIISFLMEYNKLPLESLPIEATIDQINKFKDIEEDIKSYRELIEVCRQIGISEHYIFNDEEDINCLFTTIIDIFKYNKHHLLSMPLSKLEGKMLVHVELSKFINLRLVYLDGEFSNFYSETVLKTVGGLIPKVDEKDNSLDKGMPKDFPKNWEKYYQKVSIFSSQDIEKIKNDTNFNFDIVKLSFTDAYHDIEADLTINVSLNYINYYDYTLDEKYLDFALELNKRYLEKFPKNVIAKINIFLITLKRQGELLESEQSEVMDIQEMAENNENIKLRFATEVLLKNKIKAQRVFNTFEEKDKEEFFKFPIYHFYKSL